MRIALALLVSSVAIGCASAPVESADKGDTASLIVGGTTANIASFPGMAQLETAQGPQCGATLISPEWVVTAAHCFNDGQTNGGWTRVAFGRQNSNAGGGEVVQVAQAFKHEQYDEQAMVNDIALLRLARKVTRAPAAVMKPAEFASLNKAGTQLTVIGWGATQEGGQMVTGLRQVTVPLISNAECATMNLTGITLGDKMLCAGFPGGGRDACQGDSGGPLFMTVGGKLVQVGIVSFGEGCARANSPGVYTQIAGYFDWINQKTNNALAPTPTPTPTPTPAPTPDSTTGTDTEEDPVITPGTDTGEVDTSTGDVDDEVTSGDDGDEDEERPAPKRKKKSSRAAAYQASSCAMGSAPREGGAGAALGVLLGVALVSRRRRPR